MRRMSIGNIIGANGSTIVNGVKIDAPPGASISINNGQVFINGELYESDDLKDKKIVNLIINGDAGNIESQVSVTCRNVKGDVKAGTSVNCDEITGNVVAGTSVNCDDIGRNATAGTSINCDDIGGDANAAKIMRG